MTKKIAVINGDGAGPELVQAMLNVLKATDTKAEFIMCEAGSEWWEKNGGDSYFPKETWDAMEEADVCFKGPTTTTPTPGTPKSVAVTIRQHFDLYANIRPIKTFTNHVGPLGEVDFICVREATEGLYTGIEYQLSDDVSIAIRKITRKSCERIAKQAFEIAKNKNWKTVVPLYKANILKITDGMFIDSVKKIGSDYPDIAIEDYFIDNFAQQIVKNPQRFNQNVILSTNLFMDVISEECAGLIGSIGCVYSGNYGDNYAMFEPAHGSTPKYTGLDKVNPTATILSGAWMLDYIDEKNNSKLIFDAVNHVITEGKHVTYDLRGTSKLSEMSNAIIDQINKTIK